jgi:4-amino-4-deoxy-L-arabinose transferase-like glycosyltransferase
MISAPGVGTFAIVSAMTRARAALAVAFLALLLAGLGRLPLLDPDEGRYARTAREMTERGDLVVPHLNGELRLKKPVFFYWLEIGSFSILGPSEAGARLPSALAAAGVLLWLYGFARSRLGERTALIACSILATTPLFFALARTATTDMVLAFFVFGATASLYAGIVEPGRSWGHVLLGGICLGLGMLTKGPVTLIVPALVVAVGAAARRRAPITVAGRAAAALGIMAFVALPWAALLLHRVGAEEVLEIWRREAVERFVGGLDHPERFSYFFLTSPVTFFPWSAFVPFALVSAIRRARRGEALWPALLAWSVGGFLFFSLGRGKLDSYLLPIAPAVALLAAGSLAGESGRHRGSRWAAWLMTAMAASFLLPFPIGRLVRQSPALLPSLAVGVGACAVVAAVTGRLWRGRGLQPALALLCGLLLLGAVLAMPESWAEERSTRRLAREAGLRDASGPLYVLRVRPPSVAFYAGRIVTYVPARYLLMRMLADGGPASVVLEEHRTDVVRQLLERSFRPVTRSAGLLAMRRPAAPPPYR